MSREVVIKAVSTELGGLDMVQHQFGLGFNATVSRTGRQQLAANANVQGRSHKCCQLR